jgi:transketolase
MRVEQERCKRHRRRILEISQQVPALHIAPAFSCLEIVDTIYYDLMKPGDTFIMSKGHGVIAQYVVLESLGRLTKSDLDGYCRPHGHLGAHPDLGEEIKASTGSLGHGLGIAVGMAYADKLQRKDPYSSPAKVYCLLSDGECQEGSTWEAVMMAYNLNLGNLRVYVDNNDWGGLERMPPAMRQLDKTFEAFGFTSSMIDGHDSEYLRRSGSSLFPSAMICKTIKGKGVSFMEDVPIWHYRSPNKEEYERAMQELA